MAVTPGAARGTFGQGHADSQHVQRWIFAVRYTESSERETCAADSLFRLVAIFSSYAANCGDSLTLWVSDSRPEYKLL